MNNEVLSKLLDFIDSLETEYGDVEGFEVKLEHETDEPTQVKKFTLLHLHKTDIEIK